MMNEIAIEWMFACAYDAKLTSFPLFYQDTLRHSSRKSSEESQGIRWLQFPARHSSSSIPNVHNHYYLNKFSVYPLQNQKMLKIEGVG